MLILTLIIRNPMLILENDNTMNSDFQSIRGILTSFFFRFPFLERRAIEESAGVRRRGASEPKLSSIIRFSKNGKQKKKFVRIPLL